ncbi:MAG: hypothetical protein H7Y33_15870 [Cytophagales bacterium]|nr:hypothetical protein [Rhizobacter sp.]
MIALYALALVGVCAVLLGVLLEAVISVSRKPAWGLQRQYLAAVPVVEQRVQQIAFVGGDRRGSSQTPEEAPLEAERKLAA